MQRSKGKVLAAIVVLLLMFIAYLIILNAPKTGESKSDTGMEIHEVTEEKAKEQNEVEELESDEDEIMNNNLEQTEVVENDVDDLIEEFDQLIEDLDPDSDFEDFDDLDGF